MGNTVLTVTQAIQLAAIGPCIFIILYLLFVVRNYKITFLPILYFISLTSGFIIPILSLFPEVNQHISRAVLMFNEHLGPELSFLLIIQFLLGRVPPFIYWFVLAIPLIGGGQFLALTFSNEEICLLGGEVCTAAENAMIFYRIITGSFVFMLLTFLIARKMPVITRKDVLRKQKYWLIISLVLFNIAVLAIDLAVLGEFMKKGEALFAKTMMGVAFVYIVLSSVFRVFNESFNIKPLSFNERDRELLDKIKQLIAEERPYLDLGYNRAAMSDAMGVTEQHLSRVINTAFKKSFSELMNELRVSEAKKLLRETTHPVTTISFDVGFSSITSFNRVFKEITGVSPSHFRNSKDED